VNGQLHAPAASTPGKEPLLPTGLGGWIRPEAGLDTAQIVVYNYYYYYYYYYYY
jgi:hypothetical protein